MDINYKLYTQHGVKVVNTKVVYDQIWEEYQVVSLDREEREIADSRYHAYDRNDALAMAKAILKGKR